MARSPGYYLVFSCGEASDEGSCFYLGLIAAGRGDGCEDVGGLKGDFSCRSYYKDLFVDMCCLAEILVVVLQEKTYGNIH